MLKPLLRVFIVVLIGLVCGVIGWIVGALIGGNFGEQLVFNGVRGYEATGRIGFITRRVDRFDLRLATSV